jgi:HSP20 family protein
MPKGKETQEAKGQQPQGERQGGQPSTQAVQRTGERGGGRETGITRREQYAPARPGSPFAFMRRFSEEMDRLFEDFGFGRGFPAPPPDLGLGRFGEAGGSLWSPQVEVFERGGQLIVRADLPGMTKDDVNIEVADDALVIRGERREEREENEEGYYHTERSYGSFYRSIPLPAGVDAENANATFRDGVLEITLEAPQRQSRSRRLEIREGTEAGAQPERGRAKAAGR